MKDKRKRRERTWAEAARMVLENYSDAPMTPKQILRVIEVEGLKEMSKKSGTTPLACLNAMLQSNSQAGDAIFYKLPGRISMFTLKKDALQWSRSLALPVREEQDDTADGESSGSNETSPLSGADNDGSPEETSSNASCSNESQSRLMPMTRESCRMALQAIKPKRTGVLLPRVVLTPLKVNGAHMETSSGRQDVETSSSSSSSSLTLSGSSRIDVCRNPAQHLHSIKKTVPDLVKKNRAEEIDCETPGSILVNTNLRALINLRTFNALPHNFQQQLLSLLPEVDRQVGTDGQVRPSSSALNNEFFAHAAQSWRERLADGEFTVEMQARIRQEIEKEKKMDQWKENFFEDYYGQRLGMSKEAEQTPEPVQTLVEQQVPVEAVRASRRLRDMHCKKSSRPELRRRAKNIRKAAATIKSEAGEGAETLEASIGGESKSVVDLRQTRACQLAVNTNDSQSESLALCATRLPCTLKMLPSPSVSDERVPCLPHDLSDQESKDQKRKYPEEAQSSSSFSEKKPRLDDRQSFRNTIECVHTEKPQPTKEEPKVPPIRIHLSRIKPPWVVNGQPAYKICPQIMPNSESSRRARPGIRNNTNVKARVLHARAQREAARIAIGGGGGPGGGKGPSKGGGRRKGRYLTQTRPAKRTCTQWTSNPQRTQLLPSRGIDIDTLKPVDTWMSAHKNPQSSSERHCNFTLNHVSDPAETGSATRLDIAWESRLVSETSRSQDCAPSLEASLQHTKVSHQLIHIQDKALHSNGISLKADCKPSTTSQDKEQRSVLSETDSLNCMFKDSANIAIENTQAPSPFDGDNLFSICALTNSSSVKEYAQPLNGLRVIASDQTAEMCLTVKGYKNGDLTKDIKTSMEGFPELDSVAQENLFEVQGRAGLAEATLIESLSLLVTLEGLGDGKIPLKDVKTCRIKKQASKADESWGGRSSTGQPVSGETDGVKESIEDGYSIEGGDGDAPVVNGFKADKHVKTLKVVAQSCPPRMPLKELVESKVEPQNSMVDVSVPCNSFDSTLLTNSGSQNRCINRVQPISLVNDTNSLMQVVQGSSPVVHFLAPPPSDVRLPLPLFIPSVSCSDASGREASWCLDLTTKRNPVSKSSSILNVDSPHDVVQLFSGQEGLEGPGNQLQFVSANCSQELMERGSGEQILPADPDRTVASPNGLKVQNISHTSLENPTPLPHAMFKKKSHVNSHQSRTPRRLATNAPFLPDAAVDETYPDVQGLKLFGSGFSCKLSTAKYRARASGTVPENDFCRSGQEFPDGLTVTQGAAQPAHEDWFPEDYQHDLVTMKSKNLPVHASALKKNVLNRKKVPFAPLELMEDFQHVSMIIDLPLLKFPSDSGKRIQQPLEPSSLPSQLNIQQSLFGKLSKLQLNSVTCRCATNGPIPRFSKNFAKKVLQLGKKANSIRASLSVQMFAENAGVEQLSLHCSCRLKAMVMCKGCGAFCHDDCIGPSKLCVLCLVVR